jgi:hypothetical protein
MIGLDSKELFSVIESHIFLIALCLFLLIGAAKLILEEFIALLTLWYKLLAIVREKKSMSSTVPQPQMPSRRTAENQLLFPREK